MPALTSSGRKGGVLLDCFAGSGTMLDAGLDFGASQPFGNRYLEESVLTNAVGHGREIAHFLAVAVPTLMSVILSSLSMLIRFQNPYFSFLSRKASFPPSITVVISCRISSMSIAPSDFIRPPDWSPARR